jgi:sec-independent protein translocase protein TatC
MSSHNTGNKPIRSPDMINAGEKNLHFGVPGDFEEPITAHLRELRDRFAFVFIWLFLGIAVAYPFSGKGVQLIWSEFISPEIEMAVYSPMEWIFTRLKLCLVFGLAVSTPQFFYQFYRFAAKGLYPHEKRFIQKVIPASFLFFLLGVATGYFLVLPAMFSFISSYSGDIAYAQLSVQDTLSAVITILAGFGLAFQFPLLVAFAVKMEFLKIATFSLFLSPDPTFIAQALVAFLFGILFEFSLLFARLF